MRSSICGIARVRRPLTPGSWAGVNDLALLPPQLLPGVIFLDPFDLMLYLSLVTHAPPVAAIHVKFARWVTFNVTCPITSRTISLAPTHPTAQNGEACQTSNIGKDGLFAPTFENSLFQERKARQMRQDHSRLLELNRDTFDF